VTDAVSTLALSGLTMIHGQGTRPSGGAHCDRGGAINMEHESNAVIRDMVFRECRAPFTAAVLNHGDVCGVESFGRLELRNIACYDNHLDNPNEGQSGIINIRSMYHALIMDRIKIYGNGSNSYSFCVYTTDKSWIRISNITIINCDKQISFLCGIGNHSGIGYSNIKVINQLGTHGGMLEIQSDQQFAGTATVNINNLEITGANMTYSPAMLIYCNQPILEFDSLSLHHNRSTNEDGAVFHFFGVNNQGTIHHLDMHDNVSGDSTSHVGSTLLFTQRTSLMDSHIYNNRVILPPHPNPAATGGNYVVGAMVRNWGGDDVHFENLVFENNRVEDLDNYSIVPDFGYTGNYGREIWANGHPFTVNNVLVRNSRQPNVIPETIAGDGISYSGMSYALSFGGNKVNVRNVLLEECDDGGMVLGGDSLLVDNVILRDVGRAAFYISDNFNPQAPPYYRFRNVHIENVDAVLNQLSPANQFLSQQGVLHVDLVGNYQGILPRVDFENVTVTGCDGLRHLFGFYDPADLHLRNCLFYNNTYHQLVEWDDPVTQDWNYNLVEEAVPGEGNLVGLDPRFDPDRGAPYLAPDSPCIDAGDPDASWNDMEDPAHLGFPLWPSLGGLRTDMGYTGGPHASLAPDTLWSAMPAWEPHLPQTFSLGAPWPNPFNPVTQIPFTLARPTHTRLSVHNLLGQEVAVLLDRALPAGTHRTSFLPERLASGVYLVTLEVAGRTETRSVTLLR
jgi:hypothetical protein